MDMQHLSGRLSMVADLVPPCDTFCDIGTDHAYLPIALIKAEKVRSAIAADVVLGPLGIAKTNIAAEGLADRIETRQSDGFSGIDVSNIDVAVIAGMGGLLICDILTQAGALPKTLVLQPQSEFFAVRETLDRLGYAIESERMCIDQEKYYVAMRAAVGVETCKNYRFGKLGGGVFQSYLKREKRIKEEILAALPAKADRRRQELRQELKEINEALQS